jgi:hypothetical protein
MACSRINGLFPLADLPIQILDFLFQALGTRLVERALLAREFISS